MPLNGIVRELRLVKVSFRFNFLSGYSISDKEFLIIDINCSFFSKDNDSDEIESMLITLFFVAVQYKRLPSGTSLAKLVSEILVNFATRGKLLSVLIFPVWMLLSIRIESILI